MDTVFLFLDPQQLGKIKASLSPESPALANLLMQARAALAVGPFSVMDKKQVPPSGDKHDFFSQGTYWWPDPASPNGLPYIRRDGYVNPELHNTDRSTLNAMHENVETLVLAWYYTKDVRFGQRAAMLIRTWFLDPATRMNPHLNFGQGIPGRCTGRGIGIIDTYGLPVFLDYVSLLAADSEIWPAGDHKALRGWFGEYVQWLRTSPYGQKEAREHNNHGTWYDVQVAAFALFAQQPEIARGILADTAKRHQIPHIEPDGSQPHEIARTLGLSYSTMNLKALLFLALMAMRFDIDLFHLTTPEGRGSLTAAIDYLIPYWIAPSTWPTEQIKPFPVGGSLPILRLAAHIYHEPRYEQALAAINLADNRIHLLTMPAPV